MKLRAESECVSSPSPSNTPHRVCVCAGAGGERGNSAASAVTKWDDCVEMEMNRVCMYVCMFICLFVCVCEDVDVI